jgi:hypothetical protein
MVVFELCRRLAKVKADVKSMSRKQQKHLRDWLNDLLEDGLELSEEFKTKIERGERDLREGRFRIQKR